MTTWRKMIGDEAEKQKDDFPDVTTLSGEELDTPFDDNYGGHCGLPFTAWSQQRVYFPVVYDGAEWCGSAPRNPCDEATDHQGSE